MKRRLTGLIIGIAAFALSAVSVQAGEINANEQNNVPTVLLDFTSNDRSRFLITVPHML